MKDSNWYFTLVLPKIWKIKTMRFSATGNPTKLLIWKLDQELLCSPSILSVWLCICLIYIRYKIIKEVSKIRIYSAMVWETGIQSQVETYQRHKKWYLMPPCLTLSIVRYGSRIKWSNPRNGVAPFPSPWCSSHCKGSLPVTLDYGCQLYLHFIM